MIKLEIKGLTKDQIVEIVNRVAANHKSKEFDCHDPEDIAQEAWLIALKALPNFDLEKIKDKDPAQALENWLNTVVSRRLANFYRDSYAVKQKPKKQDQSDWDYQKRFNLNNPIEISALTELNVEDGQDYQGISDIYEVIKYLTDEESEILDSVLSGERINAYFKTKLIKRIKELVKCHLN